MLKAVNLMRLDSHASQESPMNATSQPRHSLRQLTMLAVSIAVLLGCLFFLRALKETPTFGGLVLDPQTWEVIQNRDCVDGASCLRPGDRVLEVEGLDLQTYQSDWNRPLFGEVQAGQSVAILAFRDGEEFETTLKTRARTITSLLLAASVPLLFWFVGTLVFLLVRPRNASWVVLIVLFHFCAVWLVAGRVSSLQVAGAMYVFHGLIWFFLPLLVHTHLTVPYPIWPSVRRIALPVLYAVAVILMAFDLTGHFSQRFVLAWIGTAATVAIVLISVRLLLGTGPTQRMMDRVLFFGVLIGLLPMACFTVFPLMADAEARAFFVRVTQALLVVCLPIWPLSYLYAMSKAAPGPMGLRGNRLLGAYGFFCLFITAFISLYAVGDYFLPGTEGRVTWALSLALVFVLLAPLLRRRFQRFVDRTIYGIKYLPEEIIGVFAARIPRALDIASLRKILLEEVTPTLMIRESALFIWSDDEQVEKVYCEGDPVPPPVSVDSIQGWIRSSTPSLERDSGPSWVRFAVSLQGRERTLGVWLLGRRDPDDLYPAADRELLNSVANQIAPVVENIRLVERAQREVEENRRLQQQLIQSQKMEAIGRLSAGVAHDFNNLLSVILGYSSLLLVKYKGDEALTGYLDDIRDAGDRAAALTRQLLAFSRQQVMEARSVQLNHVVVDVERMLQRLAGEDVEVQTDLGDDLPKVRIDPSQMGQVVMNLAVNARDAMPDGGKFEISTRSLHLEEGLVDPIQGEVPAGDYVLLSVSDSGIGMAEDQLQRIFEPYFTTKELGKGTGLGLSMVYGIVSQFQGHIRVESELGKGTRFFIYLPAHGGDESAVGVRSPLHSNESLRGSESILVVEDEDSVRHVACEILQAQGYRVTEACDGTEALDLYDEMSRPPDLLLTDVVMPQMKGTDLAVLLTRKQPGLRVLFMSGYNEESVFSDWKTDRDRPALLTKPFSPSSLLTEIRGLLDTESVSGNLTSGDRA